MENWSSFYAIKKKQQTLVNLSVLKAQRVTLTKLKCDGKYIFHDLNAMKPMSEKAYSNLKFTDNCLQFIQRAFLFRFFA